MPYYAKIKYFVSPKLNQFIIQLGYKYKETISQRIQHRLNTDINLKTCRVKDAERTVNDVPENMDPPNEADVILLFVTNTANPYERRQL